LFVLSKIKASDVWGISPYPIYKYMGHMYKRMHVDNKNDGQKQ
jgi:DNA-binding CsgD family transcriptional regulator